MTEDEIQAFRKEFKRRIDASLPGLGAMYMSPLLDHLADLAAEAIRSTWSGPTQRGPDTWLQARVAAATEAVIWAAQRLAQRKGDGSDCPLYVRRAVAWYEKAVADASADAGA